MPETVVFKAGKPKYLMKSERNDHYLRQITNSNILQYAEIMKYFMKLGRKRRKELGADNLSSALNTSHSFRFQRVSGLL